MQECPKCLTQCNDEQKICRTCGGILPGIAKASTHQAADDDSLQQPAAAVDPAACQEENVWKPAGAKRSSWKCPKCGELVPGSFEVCWNCETSNDGTPSLGVVEEPLTDQDDDKFWTDDGSTETDEKSERVSHAQPRARQCVRCDSTKMILNASILDQGKYSDRRLYAIVEGAPEALIFKDCLYGRFRADICGDCGHVELNVENPAELYEHYLHSQT